MPAPYKVIVGPGIKKNLADIRRAIPASDVPTIEAAINQVRLWLKTHLALSGRKPNPRRYPNWRTLADDDHRVLVTYTVYDDISLVLIEEISLFVQP